MELITAFILAFSQLFFLAFAKDEDEPSNEEETKFEFSTTDLIVLGGLVFGLVYWWRQRQRQKEEEEQSLSSLHVITTRQASVSGASSGFVEKLKSGGRNVIVFYGSQTGTAEEFASRLAKDAMRYMGKKGLACDPEDCEMPDLARLAKEIPDNLALFCLATYGEGDPTDNAQEFFDWLRDADEDLTGLKYAVFALGNKTYEHYNSMGIFADEKLAALGATRVFDLGLGDDDANIDDDFIQWKDSLWPSVCETFGIDPSAQGDASLLRQYKLQTFSDDDVPAKDRLFSGEIARLNSYVNQRPPFDSKNPYLSHVTVNKELHKGGDRSCFHVELSIEGSRLRYESGDHVAIYPSNDAQSVQRLGELLSIDLDQPISLVATDEDANKKHPFPCPTTWRTAFTLYLDITSRPRTNVLLEIADYCSDDNEKSRLRQMASSKDPQGKEMYQKFVHEDCRTIVHILEDLPSCKPDVAHLCELLPRLQPRYYSISSSPKAHPKSIHVTAALVDYETPTERKNKGVATSFLKSKAPLEDVKASVPIFVRRSQFRLPYRSVTPVIMIGPGTGLAPFRGFIQERHALRNEGHTVGETILYFGCRNEKIDFLYEEELRQFQADGSLSQLHVAFSRDTDKKVYVQHLLKANAESVWELISEKNANLYVCGDAKYMARDVREVLLEIFRERGQMTADEAAAYMKKMESQRRYSADVWS